MSKGRYFCGGSALAVTFALVGVTNAMAQSSDDIQRAFVAADKNTDGKLDAAEFGTLPQGIRDKAVDANGDGSYSLAELTPSTSSGEATEVRAIVSTGTYLKSGAEDTALNIEAQSRDDLLKSGSPSIEQLIRNLSESGLNENGDNRGQNAQGYGVRTINLRNLGSGRTLILFDGVRLADDPQTNGGPAITRDPNVTGGGSQNVNNIPMEVLATVEVLKDGGSAAYGGDAAGGAVNFTPRRDLNGFEGSASYMYVADTDGVYDANIQWGKRAGSGQNFLFSAYYQHVSPLSGKDRDFVKRSWVQNQYNLGWGPYDANYMAMAFAGPGRPITSATNALIAQGYGIADPLYVTNAGITNPIQDPERGILRDDLCLELGGHRAFSATRTSLLLTDGVQTPFRSTQVTQPNCSFERWRIGNLKEDTDTYRVFADATVNMTDNLRWHNSVTFNKGQTTIVDAQIQESLACDPWPTNAPSYTTATTGSGTTPSRQCFSPSISNLSREVFAANTTGLGTTAGVTVPGYNPAVRDYLLRYYSNPIIVPASGTGPGATPAVTNANGQRVFSDLQINQITGCVTPGTTANTYVYSTIANGFNCTFASDIPVLQNRTYMLYTGTASTGLTFGTISNGFFNPGTTQLGNGGSAGSCFVFSGTSPNGSVPCVTQGSAVIVGPTLGQGYTPTNAVTNVTVNISTTTTPLNFALAMGTAGLSGLQSATCNYTPIGSTTSSTVSCAPTIAGYANAQLSSGGGQPGQYGKVVMPSGLYAPFMSMYNSAFKDHQRSFFNSQNSSLLVTQDLKGDLGEHFGNALDFTLKANYQRQVNRTVGSQLMSDRFQRALDGFASDLNDLGPDGLGCSVQETQGTRILQTAPNVFTAVTGVPYTVGAGGGTDYNPSTPGIQDAAFGFDPGANKGNRCFFFNPFDSAIRISKLNRASVLADNGTPGFVGANTPSAAGTSSAPGTVVGSTGDYQGYGNDMGLENSPGVLRWMFQQREVRSQSDRVLLQGILNGEFTKFQLPGGPIDWDIVLQYTWQNRDAFPNALGDRAINPCPFARQSVRNFTNVNNIINETSTCSGTVGLFATSNTPLTTGFNTAPIGGGYQQSVSHSVVVEWNLPFVERALLHNTFRYEESRGPNDRRFTGSPIYSTDLKWQAFDNLAFTANMGENFDQPTIQEPGSSITLSRNTNATNAWWTGVNREDVNIATQSTTYVNTALGPEHGRNYSFGAIFQTRDRASQVRVTFFSDLVGGAPTTLVDRQAIARVLTKNRIRGTDIDPDVVISCDDPTLQAFFRDNAADGLFNNQPFVQFTNGIDFYHCGDNSSIGGPNITTFTVRGVDIDNNGTVLDEGTDLGLAINVPNQINGGYSVRQGIEIGANHRVKRMIYGGVLNLTADVTWNLRNKSTDIFAYGAFISAGTDSIGTLNDGFSNFANVWGGSAGFNYSHGKHNLRLNVRWQGSVVDNSGLGLAQATVPELNRASNLNPADTTLCDVAAKGLGIPYTQQPHSDADVAALVGDILVGEGRYDPNCLISDLKGYKVHGQASVALTYRVELPADTTMTVSIDNLLGSQPAFARFNDNYNPFAAVGPDGRTIKVQVQKKF